MLIVRQFYYDIRLGGIWRLTFGQWYNGRHNISLYKHWTRCSEFETNLGLEDQPTYLNIIEVNLHNAWSRDSEMPVTIQVAIVIHWIIWRIDITRPPVQFFFTTRVCSSCRMKFEPPWNLEGLIIIILNDGLMELSCLLRMEFTGLKF